jgi:polysaccharide export outer membrane protein
MASSGNRSVTRRSAVVSLAVAALVLLLGSGMAAQQAAAKIAARDQVKVTVVGTELAAGPFVVDPDGSIDYPYLGRVQVAGLTARELGTTISEKLVAAQVLVGMPQVTVELQQTANKKVTVSGAVNARGEFMFAGELTVFSALIKAGGAAADAGDEILLIRAPRNPPAAGQGPEEDVITMSRRDIERGEFATSVMIEDGDRLVVSKARQVFIDGYVNRPGPYTIEAGTTLRQVLSLAGGATELGAVNRIRVLRNGKPVDKLDLDKTVIQPGDTITVPKRFM